VKRFVRERKKQVMTTMKKQKCGECGVFEQVSAWVVA
jgi:hypothetical protein